MMMQSMVTKDFVASFVIENLNDWGAEVNVAVTKRLDGTLVFSDTNSVLNSKPIAVYMFEMMDMLLRIQNKNEDNDRHNKQSQRKRS